MTTPQHGSWTVGARNNEVCFSGTLLGAGSSAQPMKPRWFEVRIFRTDGGRYIVAGAGRSIVVHRPTCPRLRGTHHTEVFMTNDEHPCESCGPVHGETVVREADREWAQVSDGPEAIIEKLKLRDMDGVYYLPRTSQNALDEAASHDVAIADACRRSRYIE